MFHTILILPGFSHEFLQGALRVRKMDHVSRFFKKPQFRFQNK
jgi:hypothetical protein